MQHGEEFCETQFMQMNVLAKKPHILNTLTATSLLHQPAAETKAIEGGFDTSAAAIGFGAGFVGVLAVAGLAKMFQRNLPVKGNQEALL